MTPRNSQNLPTPHTINPLKEGKNCFPRRYNNQQKSPLDDENQPEKANDPPQCETQHPNGGKMCSREREITTGPRSACTRTQHGNQNARKQFCKDEKLPPPPPSTEPALGTPTAQAAQYQIEAFLPSPPYKLTPSDRMPQSNSRPLDWPACCGCLQWWATSTHDESDDGARGNRSETVRCDEAQGDSSSGRVTMVR